MFITHFVAPEDARRYAGLHLPVALRSTQYIAFDPVRELHVLAYLLIKFF